MVELCLIDISLRFETFVSKRRLVFLVQESIRNHENIE